MGRRAETLPVAGFHFDLIGIEELGKLRKEHLRGFGVALPQKVLNSAVRERRAASC
jgi:hypothetical protein